MATTLSHIMARAIMNAFGWKVHGRGKAKLKRGKVVAPHRRIAKPHSSAPTPHATHHPEVHHKVTHEVAAFVRHLGYHHTHAKAAAHHAVTTLGHTASMPHLVKLAIGHAHKLKHG